MKQVLQTALQLEMGEHLGYVRDDPSGGASGDSHNGTRTKAVRTDVGEVGIEVPRDRAATFGTVVVPKRARRLAQRSGAAPARRRSRRLSCRAAGGGELETSVWRCPVRARSELGGL